MNVQVNGIPYEYFDHIVDMDEIRESFMKLINDCFECDFSTWYQLGYWTEKYEPHVLVKDHEVVATVTVNYVKYLYQGKEKNYLQLGGVLTKQEYRNCGLSRWLMNHIIELYKDCCDQMYLVCNDSAIDFYPQFGFYKEKEYIAEIDILHNQKNHTKLRKLTMNHSEDRDLLIHCYQQSNPYSEFPSIKCEELAVFFGLEDEKDNYYYFSEYDMVVVANLNENSLFVHDIYGKIDPACNKMDVLTVMVQSIVDYTRIMDSRNSRSLAAPIHISFGFTPNKEVTGVVTKELVEKHHTLYLLNQKENLIQQKQLRFPVLSIN